jgi:hypothetical protein
VVFGQFRPDIRKSNIRAKDPHIHRKQAKKDIMGSQGCKSEEPSASGSNGKDQPTPRLLEQVRNVMRLHHYSIHTERNYTDWIK